MTIASKALASITVVIVRRLTAMTRMGRETPEMPADIPFSEIGIMVRGHFTRDRKLRASDHPGQPVRTVAIPGGYLVARNDPPGRATRNSVRDTRASRSPGKPANG